MNKTHKCTAAAIIFIIIMFAICFNAMGNITTNKYEVTETAIMQEYIVDYGNDFEYIRPMVDRRIYKWVNDGAYIEIKRIHKEDSTGDTYGWVITKEIVLEDK